jgi:hypothetical protein
MKISLETVNNKYEELLSEGNQQHEAIQLLSDTFPPNVVRDWLVWVATAKQKAKGKRKWFGGK